jgi:hypothetical protein
MSIQRYKLDTKIDSGEVIVLSGLDTTSNRAIPRSSTHDFYSDSNIAIDVKIGDDWISFETAVTDFNRVEFAFLDDIRVTGSVDGTTLKIIGSDQKSDT